MVISHPTASKPGSIGMQMHKADLFDEYREVRVEVDP